MIQKRSLLYILFIMMAAPMRSAVMVDSLALDTLRQPMPDAVLPSGADRKDAKHPYLAAAEVVGTNGLIMAYNWLFRSNEGFSHVTMNTIERNLKHSYYWWDADYVMTNTLEHPFHGSLFYGAARANGMTIAESSLYAVGGTWMWEFVGESEKPSINDMAYTVAGGITIGETFHRIGNHVIDDSKRGAERVGREALAFILNPFRGLNRLIKGEMWKVRSYQSLDTIPLANTLSIGIRSFDGHDMPSLNTPYLSYRAHYGDIAGDEHGLFDYFDFSGTAVFGANQPFMTQARIDAQLWSRLLVEKPLSRVFFGIYNHFEYHNVLPYHKLPEAEREHRPFVYSEVAVVGPALGYRLGKSTSIEQLLSIHAIPMGAVPIGSMHGDSRGYGFGSGYGARLSTVVTARHWLRVSLGMQVSQLFTWDGFETDRHSDYDGADLSVQGESGNAVTFVFSPLLEIRPMTHWGVECGGNYIACHSNYRCHPHATIQGWQLRAGLCWYF